MQSGVWWACDACSRALAHTGWAAAEHHAAVQRAPDPTRTQSRVGSRCSVRVTRTVSRACGQAFGVLVTRTVSRACGQAFGVLVTRTFARRLMLVCLPRWCAWLTRVCLPRQLTPVCLPRVRSRVSKGWQAAHTPSMPRFGSYYIPARAYMHALSSAHAHAHTLAHTHTYVHT